jgi:peptide deformylase
VAVLPIRLIGDPVLRAETRAVGRDAAALKRVVSDMFETMDDVGGVGLAAPQVGIGLSLFTYDDHRGNRGLCFDPVLERDFDVPVEEPVREGCLSVPEISDVVARAGAVRLTGIDLEGEPVDISATGLLAVIFQHEVDHLEGRLFVDRLTGEAKRAAMRVIRQDSYGYKAQAVETQRARSLSTAFGASSAFGPGASS